jgi:mono/diheme cytochrome c family protein
MLDPKGDIMWLLVFLLSLAAIVAGSVFPSLARDLSVGAAEYKLSCAGCHGVLGRGNGPMARSLTRRPTDLTKLEEANDYQFPFLKVFQVIDGRATLPDHGTREMPVWGRRYVEDIGDSRGPYGSEAAVRERIEALVRHVQSLQER